MTGGAAHELPSSAGLRRHPYGYCVEGSRGVRTNSGMSNTFLTCVMARYEKARQIKEAQDDYCSKAQLGQWDGLGTFPEELQWESMVAILRGQVKVSAKKSDSHMSCR
jgi:hypothetical protein